MIAIMLGVYLIGVGAAFAVMFDSDDAAASILVSLVWPFLLGLGALGAAVGTYAIFIDWLRANARKDPPDGLE